MQPSFNEYDEKVHVLFKRLFNYYATTWVEEIGSSSNDNFNQTMDYPFLVKKYDRLRVNHLAKIHILQRVVPTVFINIHVYLLFPVS